MKCPMFLHSRCSPGAYLAIVMSIVLIHLSSPRHVEAQQVTYSLHPLAPVVWNGALCETFGKGMNEAVGNMRMVAGYARSDSAELLPVVWMVDDTGASDASLLAYPSSLFSGSVAVSINDVGQIVGGGIIDPITGTAVGLYWADALAMPVVFPSLAGETVGEVQHIDESGVVVGISKSVSGSKAVAWRVMPDDSIVGPLVLPTRSRATSGDDAAFGIRSVSPSSIEIVGRSAGAPVAWKVNLSNTGLMLSGGAEVLDSTGEATSVNVAGSICGKARDRVVIWGPFIGRKRNKSLLSYDTAVFGTAGRSSAINDLGMVIGDANVKVAYPAQRAVLWTSASAPMRTLESFTNGIYPFAYLEAANTINNAGDIAGYGWQGYEAGYQAFIAIPNK